MSKVTITKELQNDLKKYGEQMCVGMASYVRDKLNDRSRSAIEEFYQSYSPHSYERHYYNFRNNVFEKYYQNAHGSIVRGGVLLSPERMDDIYNTTPETVFELSIIKGMHGTFKLADTGLPPEPMDPSPFMLIKEERDRIINNISNYEKYGYERANNGKYSTFI